MRCCNSDLTSMQAAVAATFDKTASILANTSTDDGQGGRTKGTWAAVGASVACLVLPVTSPGDGSEGARQVDDERRLIRLPYGAVVTSANRLRVGTLDYEVIAVLDDQSNPMFVDVQTKRLA